MCKRFTGPHSVLQVFLEKIIAAVSQIADTLKEYSQKTLCLWHEVRKPVRQKKSTYKPARSSSADTCLLTKKTNAPVQAVSPLTQYQIVH